MSDTRVEVSGDQTSDGRLGRRTVLRGVAVGGVGLSALAACGSDDGSESGGDSGGSSEPSETPSENGGNGGGGGGGTELGTTSEVPVGGGAVFDEVVVTQPSEGTFVAFSAICTHQGCPVEGVADGTINCPCHGSQFSIEDGSVVNGPATSPLPSENVTVKGQKIMLA